MTVHATVKTGAPHNLVIADAGTHNPGDTVVLSDEQYVELAPEVKAWLTVAASPGGSSQDSQFETWLRFASSPIVVPAGQAVAPILDQIAHLDTWADYIGPQSSWTSGTMPEAWSQRDGVLNAQHVAPYVNSNLLNYQPSAPTPAIAQCYIAVSSMPGSSHPGALDVAFSAGGEITEWFSFQARDAAMWQHAAPPVITRRSPLMQGFVTVELVNTSDVDLTVSSIGIALALPPVAP